LYCCFKLLNIVKPRYLNLDKIFPWIPGRKIEHVQLRKHEMFEDTKVLIISRKSDIDRQHNSQKKMDEKTNNDTNNYTEN
jgi:hypothetical protein